MLTPSEKEELKALDDFIDHLGVSGVPDEQWGRYLSLKKKEKKMVNDNITAEDLKATAQAKLEDVTAKVQELPTTHKIAIAAMGVLVGVLISTKVTNRFRKAPVNNVFYLVQEKPDSAS